MQESTLAERIVKYLKIPVLMGISEYVALVLRENLENFGNHRHKNVVSESILCRHDRGMSAKKADIWLLGQHDADMSSTFPAKATRGDTTISQCK